MIASKLHTVIKKQGESCNKAIAGNVGKFYVRVYDCMMVLRLFI